MIRRLRGVILEALSSSADLLALWVVGLVIWPMVPVGNLLARDDLAPWMAFTLSAALVLRGRELGAGPHPMLNPRRSTMGRWMRRAAGAATPLVLLASWLTGELHTLPWLIGAEAGIVGVIVLLALGRADGETAWNPPGRAAWLYWAFFAIVVPGCASWLGFLSHQLNTPLVSQAATSGLVGLSFLSAGLVQGRVRNLSQRRAAGFRDGSAYRMDLFPYVLAFLGPSVGLFLLHLLFSQFGGLDFNQAFVGSLHVLVWAALIFPRPDPIARTVLLHEITPTSGSDPTPKDAANPFDQPPEGALRLNPLQTRRIRVVHPWLVPVRGARIADLDDPVQPLWSRPPPPLPLHIWGEARFEPDPLTRSTQGEVITVSIREEDDSAVKLEGGDGQTKRVLILRPFLPPGMSRRRRVATYAWDENIPEQSIQVIDNTVDSATLRDGDVIVIGAEGVVRAYEVEIGAPLYAHLDAAAFRPPQLEDYVKAG